MGHRQSHRHMHRHRHKHKHRHMLRHRHRPMVRVLWPVLRVPGLLVRVLWLVAIVAKAEPQAQAQE